MSKHRNEQQAYMRNVGFDVKITYNSDNLQEYVGMAYPGAATSEARWQIQKMAYNSDNLMTSVRYSDSTDDYIKVWDDRTTYDYVDI